MEGRAERATGRRAELTLRWERKLSPGKLLALTALLSEEKTLSDA
jgi:hypothetical protein